MTTQQPNHSEVNDHTWLCYYDAWFELDYEILKGIIEGGETSLYRAMNRYRTAVDSKGKKGQLTIEGTPQNLTRIDHNYSSSEVPVLPTGKPLYTVTNMMGQNFPIPFYIDISIFASRYLMDVVADLAPEAIIELGAGDGARLFELDMLGIDRSIAMYGAEQSGHARNIITSLCELDPDVNISPHPFDFKNPDFSFLKERDNILIFTHMTLMFISKIGEEFVLSLASAAKKVTCFHFEPFGHQFSTEKYAASEEQAKHFREKGFNMTFMEVLDRLQRKGRIKNLMVFKDVAYGGYIHHPKCIVSWENI